MHRQEEVAGASKELGRLQGQSRGIRRQPDEPHLRRATPREQVGLLQDVGSAAYEPPDEGEPVVRDDDLIVTRPDHREVLQEYLGGWIPQSIAAEGSARVACRRNSQD